MKSFLAQITNATGKAPRWFITDNAVEYMSDIVRKMVSNMGIEHIPAIQYKSEENGIA